MDTGKGSFIEAEMPEDEKRRKQIRDSMENKYPEHGGWFHVDQIVFVNGSRFRVKSVKPTEIRLKLLPKL